MKENHKALREAPSQTRERPLDPRTRPVMKTGDTKQRQESGETKPLCSYGKGDAWGRKVSPLKERVTVSERPRDPLGGGDKANTSKHVRR
ncbi:hypothetical protein DPEC_G00149350 [Dallia pectoralis]|uniref:Uncharacterized protein n=1 Tax=Dallia pectoralis TaxID=75939 RepID=A0ACC2GIR3_DALPE|nr:hypothetical protein DPEC_G00149350 [Dallia pectoralis]